MEAHIFYQKYANTPLEDRDRLLSNRYNSVLHGMTLREVYKEIHDIDDKLRNDEIRREKLLSAVEPLVTEVTFSK